MKDPQTLPFSLTTSSLALWLDTLAYLSPAIAANQLDQCIKNLDDCHLEPKVYFPLLINLTPACIALAISLSALNLTDAQQKLAKKSIKIAKLGIQMLKRLALSFCELADKQELDSSQTEAASYYALQLFGYSLRNCALLYEIPSKSVWKKSALLYMIARDNGSLQDKQPHKIYEFKNQSSIADVLQRNMLFSVLSPTRFTAPEINEFFKLSNSHFNLLDIGIDQIDDFNFYWSLDGDEPYPVKINSQFLPTDYLVIDTRRFAHAMQLGTLKTTLKPTTQAKLVLQLSGYQQVFSSLSTALPFTSELIIGFNPICDYFQKMDKLSKIKQLGHPEIQNMTLLPLEHEKKYFVSHKLTEIQRTPGETVKLLRTSSKLYVVAENTSLGFSTDPLCLLYKANQLATLAIIRQRITHEITGATQILLEYILGNCSIYEFKTSSGAINKALIIGEHSGHPEAFLNNGRYGVDTKIMLNKFKTLYLQTCIEYNEHFCRFKVGFDG